MHCLFLHLYAVYAIWYLLGFEHFPNISTDTLSRRFDDIFLKAISNIWALVFRLPGKDDKIFFVSFVTLPKTCQNFKILAKNFEAFCLLS